MQPGIYLNESESWDRGGVLAPNKRGSRTFTDVLCATVHTRTPRPEVLLMFQMSLIVHLYFLDSIDIYIKLVLER